MEGTHFFPHASFAPTAPTSHGGSVISVEGNSISRMSRRQTILTTSAAESRFVEAPDAHLQANTAVLLSSELN